MSLIYPVQAFRILYYGDIKIDHNGVLVAANEYTLERLIRTGVDFLMRDIRAVYK